MTGDSHIPRYASLVTTVDIMPISGHDDCQLLSQPITAYDLQVRYDKMYCTLHLNE